MSAHPLSSTAAAAIQNFELQDDLDTLPDELAYGKRRLVGIARSVASGPSIVMLDEPAAGLDETGSVELAALIRRLAEDHGMGILLVEHDVPLVMSVCDRIVCIDFGKVTATGTPEVIRADEAVVAAYLGTHDDAPMAEHRDRSGLAGQRNAWEPRTSDGSRHGDCRRAPPARR